MAAKFIVFREDTWFAPMAENAMYQHLTEAYGAGFQLIRNWSEAEVPEGWPVLLLHESGVTDSRNFEHPSNAVYVIGKTSMSLTATVTDHDGVVVIKTPHAQELWGIQVAAMVLRDREVKGI